MSLDTRVLSLPPLALATLTVANIDFNSCGKVFFIAGKTVVPIGSIEPKAPALLPL